MHRPQIWLVIQSATPTEGLWMTLKYSWIWILRYKLRGLHVSTIRPPQSNKAWLTPVTSAHKATATTCTRRTTYLRAAEEKGLNKLAWHCERDGATPVTAPDGERGHGLHLKGPWVGAQSSHAENARPLIGLCLPRCPRLIRCWEEQHLHAWEEV